VITRGQSQTVTPEWSPAHALEQAAQAEAAQRVKALEQAAERVVAQVAAELEKPEEQSLHAALEEFIPAMWSALGALQRKLQGKEK
jgi:hypothetical protein